MLDPRLAARRWNPRSRPAIVLAQPAAGTRRCLAPVVLRCPSRRSDPGSSRSSTSRSTYHSLARIGCAARSRPSSSPAATTSSTTMPAAASAWNSSCGRVDPVEDLHRQRREAAAERTVRVEGDEGRRADQRSAARSRRSRARARGSRRSRCPGSRPAAPGCRIVCHLVAPSASEPSRIDGGTARIASRPAMITIGSTSSASVSDAGEQDEAEVERPAHDEARGRGCRRRSRAPRRGSGC